MTDQRSQFSRTLLKNELFLAFGVPRLRGPRWRNPEGLGAATQLSALSYQLSASPQTHGRGAGVGRGLGVGVALGVGLIVAVGVAVAVAVGVGVGPGGVAQYLPPVFKYTGPNACPPQTIISLPVHTAV